MNTGKAIFFGLALIALAIFARDVMRPANAGLMGGGRYMGVPTGSVFSVWVVDTESGAAKSCSLASKEKKCMEWLN